MTPPFARHLVIALDYSARRIDADGCLHVSNAPISKANICPYYGSEIPGGVEQLGLEATRIYYLFRDPEELALAAPTFNNKPLMATHVAHSADDPQKDHIAGSTGTNCEFVSPYLRVDIVIWDAEDIAKIESGERKEISCGYRYTPDMTSGNHEGLHYDGIMRNIVANHVALVSEGRAGPDVVVSDSQIKDRPMLKIRSKLALMARGAVGAYVKPLLATDAKLDLNAAFEGVTAKNYDQMKPVIIGRITNDAMAKLISGAKLDGLSLVLDAMSDEDCEGEDEMTDPDAEDMTPEEKEEAERAARDKKAKDEAEAEEAKKAADKKAKDEEANSGVPPIKPGGMDKAAMDAAIRKGVADGLAAGRALDEAKREVAPVVGEVHGCDTAEKVYKFALDSAQISTAGVHPSAFQAIYRMHAKSLTNDAAPAPMAQDAASKSALVSAFPEAARFH